MTLPRLQPADFNNAQVIEWFRPGDQIGGKANLNVGAYTAQGNAVSVLRHDPQQVVTVSKCDPLGFRCNIQQGTGLILASNLGADAVLRLQWSTPVQSVGAFVVAPELLGTPFDAVMWLWLVQAQRWESVSATGVTGDIWQNPGDTVAPFLGASAPVGDQIGIVVFDGSHPMPAQCSPIGIGNLYFRA